MKRYRLRSALAVASSCILATIRVPALAGPVAAVSINPSSLIWSNVTDSTNQFLPADNDPITVTGTIKTSSTAGSSGSISVSSPAVINGSVSGNVIPVTAFSITCSGGGNIGTQPVYAAAKTGLVANTTTPCATWPKNANSTLNFSLYLLLDDRTFPADSYTSTGFAVVASAM